MSFREGYNTGLYAPSGRGKVFVAKWDGTTEPTYPGSSPSYYPSESECINNPGDFEDLGNVSSFETEPLVEKRPHYSSRESLRFKDLNPVVQTEYQVTFDCDSISAKNFAKFVLGSLDEATGIITGLNEADAEYALIFISSNPIGPKINKYFRRMTLSPNGPVQDIGDDYLVMSYMGEGLADTTNHSSSPYFDGKMLTTTTTSTSTTTTTTTA